MILYSDSHAGRPIRRTRRLLGSVATAAGLGLISACSGSVELDAAGAGESFAERADAAYAAEDLSREEDSLRGTTSPCFVLDEEAVEALADVGADGALEEQSFLSSRDEDNEALSCTLSLDDGIATILVGLTEVSSAAEMESAVAESVEQDPGLDDGVPAIDVEVEGLDRERTLVYGDDELTRAFFIQAGVLIGLQAQRDVIDRETLLDVLPVLVEQVDRVLAED